MSWAGSTSPDTSMPICPLPEQSILPQTKKPSKCSNGLAKNASSIVDSNRPQNPKPANHKEPTVINHCPNHDQWVCPKKSRPAYAFLWLLVPIAICLLIYIFTVYIPDAMLLKEQMKSPDTYPWVEDWRLHGSTMQKPKGIIDHEPSDQLPVLTETLQIRTIIIKDGKSGGGLSLFISPDGSVYGSWFGSIPVNSEKVEMFEVMMGDFEGNTDPTRLIEGTDGPDPTKLYFIAKGPFALLETLTNKKSRGVYGSMYIVGHLNPDMSASGKFHITSDKKIQKIYEWSGKKLIF